MSKLDVATNGAIARQRATALGFDAGNDWISWHDESMFVYASARFITRNKPAFGTSFIWFIWVKPMGADEQLWHHLFPGSDMGGARKKLTLRAIGAFRTTGLPLSDGFFHTDPATIDTQIDGFLNHFAEAVAHWDSGDDRVERYLVDAETAAATAPAHMLSRLNLMRTTALLAVARDAEALALARTEIAVGRDGSLFSGDESVNQLIVNHLSANEKEQSSASPRPTLSMSWASTPRPEL